jgi:hypothetical protein
MASDESSGSGYSAGQRSHRITNMALPEIVWVTDPLLDARPTWEEDEQYQVYYASSGNRVGN